MFEGIALIFALFCV